MEGEQDARLRRRSLAANAALRRLSGDSSSINNTSNISNNDTNINDNINNNINNNNSSSSSNSDNNNINTINNGILERVDHFDNDIDVHITNNIKPKGLTSSKKTTSITKESVMDNLTCSICFRLFYEPISINCGHTYCRSCIGRALSAKASQECPVCRAPLMLDTSTAKVNIVIQKLLNNHFDVELLERKEEEEEDKEEEEEKSLLVFFLQDLVVMPGQKVVLRVFEPRYLLLCERVMQGSRIFGIQRSSGSSVGTMMKIESLRNDENVRTRRVLIIECVGVEPYKPEDLTVEENTGGLHRCIANYTTPPAYVPGQADEIIFDNYNRANRIYEMTSPREKNQIINDIGPLPELGSDPLVLLFWLAAALPLHPRRKEGVLDNSLSVETRFQIFSDVLFNDVRPPRFSTTQNNSMFARAQSGLLQSCLIFSVVIFGLLYSYFYKKAMYT